MITSIFKKTKYALLASLSLGIPHLQAMELEKAKGAHFTPRSPRENPIEYSATGILWVDMDGLSKVNNLPLEALNKFLEASHILLDFKNCTRPHQVAQIKNLPSFSKCKLVEVKNFEMGKAAASDLLNLLAQKNPGEGRSFCFFSKVREADFSSLMGKKVNDTPLLKDNVSASLSPNGPCATTPAVSSLRGQAEGEEAPPPIKPFSQALKIEVGWKEIEVICNFWHSSYIKNLRDRVEEEKKAEFSFKLQSNQNKDGLLEDLSQALSNHYLFLLSLEEVDFTVDSSAPLALSSFVTHVDKLILSNCQSGNVLSDIAQRMRAFL